MQFLSANFELYALGFYGEYSVAAERNIFWGVQNFFGGNRGSTSRWRILVRWFLGLWEMDLQIIGGPRTPGSAAPANTCNLIIQRLKKRKIIKVSLVLLNICIKFVILPSYCNS